MTAWCIPAWWRSCSASLADTVWLIASDPIRGQQRCCTVPWCSTARCIHQLSCLAPAITDPCRRRDYRTTSRDHRSTASCSPPAAASNEYPACPAGKHHGRAVQSDANRADCLIQFPVISRLVAAGSIFLIPTPDWKITDQAAEKLLGAPVV